MGDEAAVVPAKRLITSEQLSPKAVAACWAVAAILMLSGVAATFLAGTGAAPASMIVSGSLFVILALMKRVPLNLELGGAKIQAGYEVSDQAFDAGRDLGQKQGVEVAISDVDKAQETGESPHDVLERRREQWGDVLITRPSMELWTDRLTVNGGRRLTEPGYSPHIAATAAGISKKQLSYWSRTGLVPPHYKGVIAMYTFRDIVFLKIVTRLLDAGISLQQIRTAISHMREKSMTDLQRITFMSDGASVYEATSTDEVIDLLQGGQGVFGIAVGGVIREVEEALEDVPSVPPDPDDDPGEAALGAFTR